MSIHCRPLARRFADIMVFGKTKKSFAEQCGIDKSRMGKFLNGKIPPSMIELDRICAALQCQPNDVIEWINNSE